MDDSSTNPCAPEPTTDGHRGGSSLWFVWAFLLLIVLYPLSIGPAAKLHQAYPATRPAIETAYKPLTSLMMHSPPIRDALLQYAIKVWRLSPDHPTTTTAPQTNSPAPPGK